MYLIQKHVFVREQYTLNALKFGGKNSTERDLVDGGKIFRNIKTTVKKNLQHPMKMSLRVNYF
jgi:hypothetical protein